VKVSWLYEYNKKELRMFSQLHKIKLIIGISLVFLVSCSESKSDVGGNDFNIIHHLKFDWRIKENSDDFYKITTALYESFGKLNVENAFKDLRNINMFSEYGNFSGINIYISKGISFAELKKNLAKISNDKVKVSIGNNTLKDNVLHRFYNIHILLKPVGSCKIYKMKNFNNMPEVIRYVSIILTLSQKRAIFLFVDYEYKEKEKKYKFQYEFFGNCDFKKNILEELENEVKMQP
jgi:hypothetical protein